MPRGGVTRNANSRMIVALIVWTMVLQNLVTFCEAQACLPNGQCDKHERCPVWKEEGECLLNKTYMRTYCPVSCSQDESRAVPAGACENAHERCSVWAGLGECENNKDMRKYCPKACGFCKSDDDDDDEDGDEGCSDSHKNCKFWAKKGECENNPGWMFENCAAACGTCKKAAASVGRDKRKAVEEDNAAEGDILAASAAFGVKQIAEGNQMVETLDKIKESTAYMNSEQFTTLPAKVRKNCQNRNELCSFWAVIGECKNNEAYMATNCAPACMSCHMIDIATRCPVLPNAKAALNPGDLNKMFERIVATAPGNQTEPPDDLFEGEPAWTVHVLSRPSENPATEISAVQDKTLPPWVITLDNFVTPEECNAMIQLGYEYEYLRSEDVGGVKFDGTHDSVQSERRTSENAWCSDFKGCRKREVPQRLHDRMSRVMKIPAVNSEDLQLLKYEVGQFYRTHHDYIPHQVDRQCGPRILTFFLYLSDVEEGGGTNFPQLDMTVEPKQGRALLWPSVLDSDPMKKDSRMFHQALEVIAGTKFAANGWIHMYDYVTPQSKGCN